MIRRQHLSGKVPRLNGWVTFLAALSFLLAASPTHAAESETLIGQVVCSQCWHEADRTQIAYGTPSDLTCAVNCGAAGIPSALAVRNSTDGSYRLYELSDAPGGQAGWTAWVGMFVQVRGTLDGDRLRETRSVKLLQESPWPVAEAAHVHGAPAELRWTDPDGKSVDLEDYRGKFVVLNFWATWCAPCVREMPDLVEIQERFAADGVQVIGAAAEPVEETDRVVSFAEEYGINFPIWLGADAGQMESLGLGRALPSTAILDRDGNVVERIQGTVKPRGLRRTLQKLVAGELRYEEKPDEERIAQAKDPHGGDDHGHDHGEEDGHGHPPDTDEASLVPS